MTITLLSFHFRWLDPLGIIGVFHRKGFNDVDLVWGSNERSEGLDHNIEKHIKAHNDFDSVEEAMTTIDDVIRNGSLNEAKSKWDKAVFEKDGYTVVVSLNVRTIKAI